MPVPYIANVTDNLDRGHLARRAGNEPSRSLKLCNIMEKVPSTVVRCEIGSPTQIIRVMQL